MKKIFKFSLILLLLLKHAVYADVVEEIIISGNNRISNETIKVFSNIKTGNDIDEEKINLIIKDLYETNFFENITVNFNENKLLINVVELPIIQNIFIEGLSAKKNIKMINDNLNIRAKSSLSNELLKSEINSLKNILRQKGYYFAEINTYIENLQDNKVNLRFDLDIGEKTKIKKITFVGPKIFKERKLKSVVISEENKFWKFLSQKKYVNEDLIATDERLLKNFYLNEGYYDVKINSSLAKQVNKNEFEIIYNIEPNEKIYFNDLTINVPVDFDENNFENLRLLLTSLKGSHYSINAVNNIIEEIDVIALNEEFISVKATATESIELNKLDILFDIRETEKFFVEKINIFGNNITKESVIRNQFVLDEGDGFNEILANRSINNIRNLNFFKKVNTEILEGVNKNSKIINIEVEEKPTGEITAGAGVGTSGGTLVAGVKENNYLGKGLSVQANGTLTGDSIKGLFQVTNPNFNNTDKSVFANIQATEIDQLKKFGYKTNKAGFAFGTNFEYLNDFNLGISTSNFYEKIETNSTASARQRKQEGDYWDTFAMLSFDYDKRNQKFKTSDGFRSRYSINLPVISETNTLTNSYNYKVFGELYKDNISTFSIFLKSANSITSDDIKLTERLYIPSNKLRGFENGKIGPKDGGDFIGGNFVSTVNFNTTIPKLFENSESLDALLFFDMGNVWGVDYDSSIDDSDKIRSSIGIGIDWFSLVGPINLSLTEVITKDSTDITETFRFNIGTTF